MTPYFPRQTVEWAAHELSPHRRFSLSILPMGIVTGAAVRLLRLGALTINSSPGWGTVGLAVALGAIVLFGMTTLHLANFPVRRWWWRGPAFGLIEAFGEFVVSAALVAAGLEPMGTGLATAGDLPGIAASLLWTRPALCALFALVLALVVQTVRSYLLREARPSGAAHS